MTTLEENIARTIRDLDGVKEAIQAQGVDVPAGTPITAYAELIGQISAGSDPGMALDFFNNRLTVTEYGPQYDELTAGITDGKTLFMLCPVTSFSADLSNLENGLGMFSECMDMTSFVSPLPALLNGESMFDSCSGLVTFTSELPSLTEGTFMFHNCGKLTEFICGLPSLTNSNNMFYNCTSLTTFRSDLSSLTDGTDMFYGCNSLTVESLMHILTTLPDRTGTGSATITIGPVNRNKLTADQLAVATDKNWTVN